MGSEMCIRDSVDPQLVTEEVFDRALAQEKVPQGYIQTYLVLRERIRALESEVGQVNTAVFAETATHIRLPKLLEEKHVLPQL